MALCINPNESGLLSVDLTSPVECKSYVLVDANEYNIMLATYDITPFDIGQSFIWGFGTYITFWYMGYCIKMARGVIRRA